MRVWIDADACPRLARDQVIKFALKRNFSVILVAGQAQPRPNFACVQLIVVPSGPDAADDYIVEHVAANELVTCSDIPLADRLIKKRAIALDPRGNEFTERNMRDHGQMSGGQRAYDERDKQAFSNALDRILTRLAKLSSNTSTD